VATFDHEHDHQHGHHELPVDVSPDGHRGAFPQVLGGIRRLAAPQRDGHKVHAQPAATDGDDGLAQGPPGAPIPAHLNRADQIADEFDSIHAVTSLLQIDPMASPPMRAHRDARMRADRAAHGSVSHAKMRAKEQTKLC
jgi:hypothetical protein